MILGAGRGTRLDPLGLRVPKILVDIGGEPLLARQLRYLQGEGVDRVVVNTHHLADQVEQFAAGYRGGVELVLVHEDELLGTAGGVRNALGLFSTPLVVLYGDVLIDERLAPLLDQHRGAGAVATIACYPADSTVDKGVVRVDANDHVTAFVEKEPGGGGPGLVNAGVYVIESALVEGLAPGSVADFGHDVFPDALARGLRIAAHRLRAPVLDVGTPEALALARSEP